MPSAVVTLPSTHRGELRSPKTKELRRFLQTFDKSPSTALTELLQACWLRTDESAYGPDFQWSKALADDRLYAWIQMVILGFGPLLRFESQCDDSECRKQHAQATQTTADLSQAPVRALPEASLAVLRSGQNRHETMVAGVRVWFQLAAGDLEAQVRAAKSESETLAALILEVEGIGTDRAAIIDWLDDLDYSDVMALAEQIRDAGCSVDVSIEVVCEHCGRLKTVVVPFVEKWTRLRARSA